MAEFAPRAPAQGSQYRPSIPRPPGEPRAPARGPKWRGGGDMRSWVYKIQKWPVLRNLHSIAFQYVLRAPVTTMTRRQPSAKKKDHFPKLAELHRRSPVPPPPVPRSRTRKSAKGEGTGINADTESDTESDADSDTDGGTVGTATDGGGSGTAFPRERSYTSGSQLSTAGEEGGDPDTGEEGGDPDTDTYADDGEVFPPPSYYFEHRKRRERKMAERAAQLEEELDAGNGGGEASATTDAGAVQFLGGVMKPLVVVFVEVVDQTGVARHGFYAIESMRIINKKNVQNQTVHPNITTNVKFNFLRQVARPLLERGEGLVFLELCTPLDHIIPRRLAGTR